MGSDPDDGALLTGDGRRSGGQHFRVDRHCAFRVPAQCAPSSGSLPTGADNQTFCYDDLSRLTWADASGAPPWGGSLTAGSLTSAQYTQSFAYDTFDRLTSGPTGGYTYGSSHKDAATSIGSAYTAAYDAAGNMVCRAPTASQTCAGSPPSYTGAGLTYDNEGRLVGW